jgi:hypothetical protein
MIPVRQREYAITSRTHEDGRLITKNLSFCTAIMGVHDSTGIAFLAHIDGLTWGGSADMRNELRRHVDDLGSFRLYIYGGCTPCLTLPIFAGGIYALAIGQLFISIGALALALAFSATRMMIAVWWTKHFAARPKHIGYSPFICNTHVELNASPHAKPLISFTLLKPEKQKFKAPENAKMKLSKAPLSL